MSVPQIPVHVMKTLIAPTVTVLLAVLVNKDSLAMARSVKVNRGIVSNHPNMRTKLKYNNFISKALG